MGRRSFRDVGKRMRRCDDVDLAVSSKGFDELIDQTRINERLITLNINDIRKFFRFLCYFRHAIGPALMTVRSQRNLRSPTKGRARDPHVVRGDDDGIQFPGPATPLPNAAKQWFASD